MIRIKCPYCGERDHSEFSYGGDATIKYPDLDASVEEWHDAIFLRENIRGVQFETWHHGNGCRMWLIVERDTMTHEIHSVRPAHGGNAKALAPAKPGKSSKATKKTSKKDTKTATKNNGAASKKESKE